MKIINFGSLNNDYVYHVSDFVRPGETIPAKDMQVHAGGKGLNQSLAIARSGNCVLHAGAIGNDGTALKKLLCDAGADTNWLLHTETKTGHAIIQLSDSGQNAILVYGGANQCLTEQYVDEILQLGKPGDFVLLQNECNMLREIMQKAHNKGLGVAWNPSPFPERIETYPLDCVDCFIVNEYEAEQLAGEAYINFDRLLDKLIKMFPEKIIVLTCGKEGVLCYCGGGVYKHKAFEVKALDTTAAGDTFCGYFLGSLCRGVPCNKSLEIASAAAAIAVTREGAAPSIPTMEEVEAFILNKRNAL